MNKTVGSWALYDVANTVFNMGVVGLFLPLLINEKPGTSDADLGFPIAVSMVIVLVISPFVGALTDQVKVRLKIFTMLNLTAVLSIGLIGFSESLTGSLIFFAVAFICVYLAELIYNALLAEASTARNRGKIGGLAIGLGFVGSLAVILVALQFTGNNSSYRLVFLGIAAIFFLSAFPIHVVFKESPGGKGQNKGGSILKSTWIQITMTRDHFRERPKLLMFFVARFFYMIAVTTASTFAVLYGIKTIGFSERQVELVLLVGIVVAIPSAVLWGYVVDRVGTASALRWNLLGWVVILSGSIAIPWMNLTSQLWWMLGAFTGLCFGGLWVADRPLLIQLSSSKLGEMFGIYGAVSRLAFLTGALLWPLIAVTLDLGQPIAILFLLCCVLVGLLVLIWQIGPQSKLGVNSR